MLTRLLLFFLWSNLFLFFVKHAHCCCFDTTMPAGKKRIKSRKTNRWLYCVLWVLCKAFFYIFFYCIGVWNDYDWSLMLGLSSLIGAAIHPLYPLSFHTMHEWESYNRNNIAVVSDIVRSEFFSLRCVYTMLYLKKKKEKRNIYVQQKRLIKNTAFHFDRIITLYVYNEYFFSLVILAFLQTLCFG